MAGPGKGFYRLIATLARNLLRDCHDRQRVGTLIATITGNHARVTTVARQAIAVPTRTVAGVRVAMPAPRPQRRLEKLARYYGAAGGCTNLGVRALEKAFVHQRRAGRFWVRG